MVACRGRKGNWDLEESGERLKGEFFFRGGPERNFFERKNRGVLKRRDGLLISCRLCRR